MRLKALYLASFILASGLPAQSASLRDNYENCVARAYLDLLIRGEPRTPLTAERAVQGCESELIALQSLLMNTNMDPKMAFSMISTIRLSAKRRLMN